MGFGHRVYKNFDPRMKIIKKACFGVLEKLGVRTKLLEIAIELEEIALKDDYFIERKLYPNVDFYSGVIYNAIGTPANMFTAIFALGRLPGLDRAVDGDARGPRLQDRPPAPDLHRAERCAPTSRSTSARGERRPRERARSPPGWADGELLPLDDARRARRRLRVREGAAATPPCGSGRAAALRRAARARLARDAAALGLGRSTPRTRARALAELATAAFDDGDGIVRLAGERATRRRLHLVGVAARARRRAARRGAR